MSFNVWQPKGNILAHSGTSFFPTNPNVLYEGNSQLGLSGNVFKMWYCNVASPNGIYYAESSDGVTWTQDSNNPIIASNTVYPKIFKNGSTYYLYCNVTTDAEATIRVYTSSDGVTWVLQNSSALSVSQTWENGSIFQLSVCAIDASGTWWGYYSGNNSNNGTGYLEGQCTSTDGIHWTKTGISPITSMSSGTLKSGASWLGSSNFTFSKIGGIYYGWSQTVLVGGPGYPSGVFAGNVPTDIMRWSAPSPSGPWTALGSLTYYRNAANEGMSGANITPLGQVADPSIVQANGQTWIFYTATPDGEGLATYYEINAALADMPIANLVETYEGVQNIPIPFPSGDMSLNFTLLASDTFSRANLGPNWSQSFVGAGHAVAQIVSDIVEGTVAGDESTYFYNALNWGNDQWSKIALQEFSVVGTQVGVSLRNATNASGAYYKNILYGSAGGFGTADNSLYITVYAGGSQDTSYGPFSFVTPEAGDEITATCVGSTICIYYNGYLCLVETDSTIGSGAPGFTIIISTGEPVNSAGLNNWAGGAFQSAPFIPPFGLPATVVGFSPNWYEGQNNAGLSFYISPGSINGIVYPGSLQTLNIPINPQTGLLNSPVTVYFWLNSSGQIQQGLSLPISGPGLNVYPIAAVNAINVLTGTRPNGFSPQTTQAPGIAAVIDLRPITQTNFEF